MDNLVERVKSECATTFFAPLEKYGLDRFGRVYGCTQLQAEVLFSEAGYPERQHFFGRWNPFLPRPFRAMMIDSSRRREGLPKNHLFVFHYGLSEWRIRRHVRRGEETYDRLNELVCESQPQFCSEDFIEWYNEKLSPASFILAYFVNLRVPCIVGHKDLQHEIMSHMKSSRDDALALFDELDPYGGVQKKYLSKVPIHIYDMLGKPKEVHF